MNVFLIITHSLPISLRSFILLSTLTPRSHELLPRSFHAHPYCGVTVSIKARDLRQVASGASATFEMTAFSL